MPLDKELPPSEIKILVVDDEMVSVSRLKNQLEMLGYTPCGTVNSGEKAIEIAQQERPALILMDIFLEGRLDGIEAADYIRTTLGIPVVFVTAHDEKEVLDRAKQAMPFGYITKPFQKKELKATIEMALYVAAMDARRRQAEIKLKKYRDELEKKVEERTRQLIAVNQQLNEEIEKRRAINTELRKTNEKLEMQHRLYRQDNEIAQMILKNVVKSDPIQYANVKYYLSPMELVGGDLFLVSKGPNGSQYFFMGDFTGHGLPAAISAIPISSIFYKMAEKGLAVDEIVSEMNRKLIAVMPSSLFLCACIIRLQCSDRTITLWNGGLPDVFIVGNRQVKKKLPSQYFPLGIMEENRFDTSSRKTEVSEGDRIFLYTDGVIEAINPWGETYGRHRLENHFNNINRPEDIFETIRRDLKTFRGNIPQSDDIALAEILPMG